MSNDFFWEQNERLQFTVISGRRAGQLLACKALSLGLCPWDNPRNSGYDQEWQDFRTLVEQRQPFRDFEFAVKASETTTLYLLSSGDPVFDKRGNFKGYRGTAKDISSQKSIEAEIRKLNQTLELRVIERTAALRKSNEQLSQAMKQLAQSEKLASLGNLVAGVAHELNTPLGNALIASTSLCSQVGALKESVACGSLKKSELVDFADTCAEGCQIIERNTQRAVALITNFKQVAVDQTSVQRREFNLHTTVHEVMGTLSPLMRKHQHALSLDIDPSICMESYPGPLDQVITNIVTNATVHAFPESQAGHILITASKLGHDKIALLMSDNGVGIPADRQRRVFDPFYTTRLGQGGSGLGLYIVYNIVTSLLGGNIQLLSVPNGGTCFFIQLPCRAPQQEENHDDFLAGSQSFSARLHYE